MNFPGKKLAISLLVASLSTPAMAAMYAAPSSNDMFYEAGVVYGTAGDKSFSEMVWAQSDVDNAITAHIPTINNRLGFTASVGMWLNKAHKNNLILTYTHLKSKADESQSVTGTDTLVNMMGVLPQDAAAGGANERTLTAATGTFGAKFNYNEVNLLTHTVNMSSMPGRVDYHTFYGVTFVHVKKSIDSVFSGTTTDGAIVATTDTVSYRNTSYGIAPHIGFMADWRLTQNIIFGGDLSTAMIVGDHKSSWDETQVTNAVTTTYQETKSDNIWAAPLVEANLHLKASFDFKQDSHFELMAGFGAKRIMTDGSADTFNEVNGDNSHNIKDNVVVRNWFLTAKYMA